MKALPKVPARVYGRDFSNVLASMRKPERSAALASSRAASMHLARAYRRVLQQSLQSSATPQAKEALVYCWKSRPKPLQKIKAYVKDALPKGHQAKCPYCGLAAELSTFDHFLEKADLPELVFYYRNLVPCCHACNIGRATSFDAGTQRVLYAYDEGVNRIPQVLCASIAERRGRPLATFYLQDPLPAGADVYARHFASLKLARRYREWAATKILELYDGLPDANDPSGAFAAQASRYSLRWGANDPTAALLLGMAAAPEVLRCLDL